MRRIFAANARDQRFYLTRWDRDMTLVNQESFFPFERPRQYIFSFVYENGRKKEIRFQTLTNNMLIAQKFVTCILEVFSILKYLELAPIFALNQPILSIIKMENSSASRPRAISAFLPQPGVSQCQHLVVQRVQPIHILVHPCPKPRELQIEVAIIEEAVEVAQPVNQMNPGRERAISQKSAIRPIKTRIDLIDYQKRLQDYLKYKPQTEYGQFQKRAQRMFTQEVNHFGLANFNRKWCNRLYRQNLSKKPQDTKYKKKKQPQTSKTYYQMYSEPQSAQQEKTIANKSITWKEHTRFMIDEKYQEQLYGRQSPISFFTSEPLATPKKITLQNRNQVIQSLQKAVSLLKQLPPKDQSIPIKQDYVKESNSNQFYLKKTKNQIVQIDVDQISDIPNKGQRLQGYKRRTVKK